MTNTEIAEEMRRLSGLLDEALRWAADRIKDYAEKESAYRKAKSDAWVRVRVEIPSGTVPERSAWVESVTADLRQGPRHRRGDAPALLRGDPVPPIAALRPSVRPRRRAGRGRVLTDGARLMGWDPLEDEHPPTREQWDRGVAPLPVPVEPEHVYRCHCGAEHEDAGRMVSHLMVAHGRSRADAMRACGVDLTETGRRRR